MASVEAQTPRTARLEQERLFRERGLKNKRFALQLWRVANGGVFVFFILANYLIRQTQTTWPPIGIARLDATIPALISVGLLISGWIASRTLAAIRQENREGAQWGIFATLTLGLVFLIGLAFVWRQAQPGGSYTAIFFAMTGFHAAHVLIGMLLFAYVFGRLQQGAYSRDNHWSAEAVVIFWHFVDVMWLLYFIVLYII